MAEQKTINVLGDTQREQWHAVVRILREAGPVMTRDGINGICDELDRYIDYAEDIFDELRKEEQGAEKS